ncbi:MAG: rod shape-determining protein MreC [Flavobacteriia bacterium]|nr:rod shape-determining protein MreC [Flavobacteriia bacterium]
MHNLRAFFRRFRVFLLFVLLQVFALSNYFTSLNFPRSQYLTTASSIAGSFLSIEFEITKHWNLGTNNEKLQKENIRLRKKMPNSFIRLNNGIVKINDTLYKQQYEYIPSIVINSTFDKRNNYFTLNSGSSQGIKRGMGVFSDKGIVGVIHNVSENYSVVKSVLTSDINLDVMIESSGAFGLLKWNGINSRIGSIDGISNDIKIKKWSKVVTRGGSGIFPRGLMVGKIKKLGSVEGKPLWDVSIVYSEDYRKIQNVYIVKNLMQEEQNKLEDKIPEDKEE